MNKDWGKAIAQLCVIVQNNTDLKEPVLQYVEFMKTIYGIDGADFSGYLQRMGTKWGDCG